MRNFSLVIIFLIFLNTVSFAQKGVKTTGMAQAKQEMYMTDEDVYKKARELAIVNAIENAFGTYVEQETDINIRDGKTSYSIYGSTKVKGDWIEEINVEYEEDYRVEKGQFGTRKVRYITCSVKGVARETISKANIDYLVLNCPSKACRTAEFITNEQLYLFFKSPVNGYLSIFLDDGNMVYRLLPYMNMTDEFQNGIHVKGDIDYLFFSWENNILDISRNVLDEVEIFTNKHLEYNDIYIIFSEAPFVKPILNESAQVNNLILPKSISQAKFQKWLTNNRHANSSFQDIRRTITIKPD